MSSDSSDGAQDEVAIVEDDWSINDDFFYTFEFEAEIPCNCGEPDEIVSDYSDEDTVAAEAVDETYDGDALIKAMGLLMPRKENDNLHGEIGEINNYNEETRACYGERLRWSTLDIKTRNALHAIAPSIDDARRLGLSEEIINVLRKVSTEQEARAHQEIKAKEKVPTLAKVEISTPTVVVSNEKIRTERNYQWHR